MSRFHASVMSSAALLLAGCELKSPADEPAEAEPPAVGGQQIVAPAPHVPALYAGVLPCADCAGIRYELDLRSETVYFLRTSYIGTEPDATFEDIGRWSISAPPAMIVLQGARAAPELFAIEDAVTLRKRDIEGKEIESGLNYDITLQPSYVPLEPSMRLRGMYRIAKSGANEIFEECLTGLKLVIADEGDRAALRQAYEAARAEPQQSVLASLEGRIVKRAAPSGSGSPDAPIDALVVVASVRLEPGDTCQSPHEEP